MIMRELFIKYFGRILAILGCSTVVTACYAAPPMPYQSKLEGRVLDAETGEPLNGISINVDHGYAQKATAEDGSFSVWCDRDDQQESFVIECTDVDGSVNGLYESVSETITVEESQDFIIEMSPKK